MSMLLALVFELWSFKKSCGKKHVPLVAVPFAVKKSELSSAQLAAFVRIKRILLFVIVMLALMLGSLNYLHGWVGVLWKNGLIL